MKHIVVLTEMNEQKVHKWVVIEMPPLILTWHGMYFMQISQERYQYVEVE